MAKPTLGTTFGSRCRLCRCTVDTPNVGTDGIIHVVTAVDIISEHQCPISDGINNITSIAPEPLETKLRGASIQNG